MTLFSGDIETELMAQGSVIANGMLAMAALVALIYIVRSYVAAQSASSGEHLNTDKPERRGYDAGSASAPESSDGAPMPADPAASDVRGVEYAERFEGGGPAPGPVDPFPKDRLVAQDLLPKDAANEQWARVNPAASGDVDDKNYLNAGYLVGVNTVSGSMRNSNLQLRSEPPNPRARVSVWGQSTIEPDLNRRPFEIDGACY